MSNSRALGMAVCSVVLIIVATLALFATYVATSGSDTNPTIGKIAQVQCRLTIVPTGNAIKAHETCVEEKHVDGEKLGKSYPANASLEDFEWEDGCLYHCIYGKMGLLSGDLTSPVKKLTKGMLAAQSGPAEKFVGEIIAVWNDCIEIAVNYGKRKGFDVCKFFTYHLFCAGTKITEIMEKSEVAY